MKSSIYLLFLFILPASISLAQETFPKKNILKQISSDKIFLQDIDQDNDLDLYSLDNNFLDIIINYDNAEKYYSDQSIYIDDYVEDFTLTDIDGDGIKDMIYVNWDIFWRKGISSTEFLEKDILTSLEPYFSYETVLDYDLDGDIDLIYSIGGLLILKKNDGFGNFDNQDTIDINLNFSTKLTFEDMDSDGDLDLFISEYNKYGNYEYNLYFIENEDLTFTNIKTVLNLDTDVFLNYTLEDINNDGLEDVFYFHNNGEISYKINLGDGAFEPAVLIEVNGFDFTEFYLVDINDDEILDVFLIDKFANRSAWKRNNGSEIFSEHIEFDININGFNSHVYFDDVDSDDKKEIIITGFNVIIYYNISPEGIIENSTSLTESYSAFDFKFGDFNNDSTEDILMVGSNSLTLVEQYANGKYGYRTKLITSNQSSDFTYAHFFDYDLDGDLDVLGSSIFSGLQFFENYNGLGDFNDGVLINDYSGDIGTLVDIDQDGNLDLLSYKSQPHTYSITYYEPGGFINQDIIYTGISFSTIGLEAFDMDDDGDIDILIVMDDKFAWLENVNGTFAEPVSTIISGEEILDYQIMDINKDGKKEIILSYFSNGFKIAYFQNGSNQLWEETILDVESTGPIFQIAYFNDDDEFDILTGGNFKDYSIHFQKNTLFDEIIQVDENAKIFYEDASGDNKKDFLYSYSSGSRLALGPNLFDSKAFKGITYLDENKNGIFDPEEIGINEQLMQLSPASLFSYSFDNGLYNLVANEGDYTIFCEPSENFELTTSTSIDTSIEFSSVYLNFGLTPKTDLDNIDIDISSSATRCGFEVPFWLTVKNAGTYTRDGQIRFELDPTTTIISSIPSPSSNIDGTLFFDIDQLPPTHDQQIKLILQMPGVQALGDTVTFQSNVEFYNETGEVVQVSNETYKSEINCAYDPNDKQVKPIYPPYGNKVLLTDTLSYMIRFQNTGTDTAFNIRIDDFIDENLDLTSFKLIGTSHNARLTISDNRMISFYFDDILLPDSTTNNALSQGFIKFKLAPIADISNNTFVYNTADIFFDFNPPIITNETTTEFVENFIVGNEENAFKQVLIYPNPTSNLLQIDMSLVNNLGFNYSIVDPLGRVLIDAQSETARESIDLSNFLLNSGMYHILIQQDEKSYTKTFSIIK